MAQIFLCYTRENEIQVRKLYRRLHAAGFRPWMTTLDIRPGQPWQQEVHRALRASTWVLVCLSPYAVRTMQQEDPCAFTLVLEALEALPGGWLDTLLVRLETCAVPEPLRPLQRYDLSAVGEFERLVHALRVSGPSRQHSELGTWPEAFAARMPPTPPRVAASSAAAGALAPSLTNRIDMAFVRIHAGVFAMGVPASDVMGSYHETPAHRVRISQPFDLGATPVTQTQWAAVMGVHPGAGPGDPTRPVEQVSWHDVQTFLQRLKTTEGGVPYRLPTEAEWEYACRAGSTTAYSFGDDPGQLDAYAWYAANATGKAHPVGQLRPNAWGLYDMHGNVGEWVHDWYDAEYYARSPTCDPHGPDSGTARVHRGGSWYDSAGLCGSSSRSRWHPREHIRGLGFRVLREVR